MLRRSGDGQWLNEVPNGYPLILAVLSPYTQDPIVAAQLLNVVCGVLTVWASYAAACALTLSHPHGWIVAALVALWPHQINYARYALTETPTGALIAVSTWAAVTGRPAAAGMALGAAATLRTTLLPLCAAIPFVSGVLWGRRAVLGAVSGAALALGMFIGMASRSGHAGLGQNLPTNIAVARASIHGEFAWDASVPTLKRAVLDYASDIRDSPRRFAIQRLESLNELWGPYPLEAERGTVQRLAIGLRFPVVLLAIVGFAALRGDRRRWVAVLPLMVTTGIHVLLFSTARFGVPVEPQLLLLAVAGVAHLRRRDGHAAA